MDHIGEDLLPGPLPCTIDRTQEGVLGTDLGFRGAMF